MKAKKSINSKKNQRFFLDNKKAEERVLSIYLFVIYIIVTLGIVAGVLLFHGPQDIRTYEAEILNDEIISCITDQGELHDHALDSTINILNNNECSFNFEDKTQKYNGEQQYAAKINIYKFDPKTLISTIEAGRTDYLQCLPGKKQPVCLTRELYILNKDQQYLLEVTTAIGKVDQNTKT